MALHKLSGTYSPSMIRPEPPPAHEHCRESLMSMHTNKVIKIDELILVSLCTEIIYKCILRELTYDEYILTNSFQPFKKTGSYYRIKR